MITEEERSKNSPARGRRSDSPGGGRLSWRRTPRLVCAAALILACVLIVMYEVQYRSVEACVVSWWMNGIIPGGARPAGDHVLMYLPEAAKGAVDGPPYMTAPGPELIALHITVECASYVVLIPLLLLSAFLMGATTVSWVRWFIGTLAGSIGIFIVNQLRLAVIVYSTNTWGMSPGYELSHILVGSIVGLCGFIGCFFLALKIMNPKRRARAGIQRRESASVVASG